MALTIWRERAATHLREQDTRWPILLVEKNREWLYLVDEAPGQETHRSRREPELNAELKELQESSVAHAVNTRNRRAG